MPLATMLESFGIDGSAKDLYVTLARDPGKSLSGVQNQLGLDDDEFALHLAALTETGVVHRRGEDHVEVLPPDQVLERLVEQERRRAEERLEELGRLKQSLPALIDDYLQPRMSGDPEGRLFTLDSAHAVRAFLYKASENAEKSVRNMVPGGPMPPEAIEPGLALDLKTLGRGIRIQMIVSEESIQSPHWFDYLRTIHAAGADVRVHAAPPLLVVLFDEDTMVVPRSEEVGACVLASAEFISPAVHLFEVIWSEARELPDEVESAEETSLESRTLQVLTLLAQGNTDAAIARRLGVSPRTVRRMVSDLCSRLHAHSRFEAGVLAAQRGWLSSGRGERPEALPEFMQG